MDNADARTQRRIARLLLAMAWDRKTWKWHLFANFGGALRHFYYIQLARLNGQTKYISHWRSELNYLMWDRLIHFYDSETKGRWDKIKALNEVVDDLHRCDSFYLTYAITHVKESYDLRRIKTKLSPDVAASFYRKLDKKISKLIAYKGK